jgi:hypothetical protein
MTAGIWHDVSMATSSKPKRLADAYRFPGFQPRAMLRGVFGDRKARVITLVRRSKKTVCGNCGTAQYGWYDRAIRRARDLSNGDTRVYLEFEVRRVARPLQPCSPKYVFDNIRGMLRPKICCR